MTDIINKKMSIDQYDILYARLDQAHSVIVALADADEERFSALLAPAELLSQAEDALQGLFVESEQA